MIRGIGHRPLFNEYFRHDITFLARMRAYFLAVAEKSIAQVELSFHRHNIACAGVHPGLRK
jgi:hypothetical protein